MPTLNQLYKNRRLKKSNLNKTPALENCPQKKAICIKLVIRAPKKPNSALRKIAKLKLTNKKIIYAYIPGEGHNLQEYSTVLVRGGRVKDLPGVKYHIIRGKFDLLGLKDRKTSKSKYGTKNLKKIVINNLQLNGKKHLNENFLKFSFKKISKTNKKKPQNLIKLSIAYCSFVFKLNKITKFNNYFLIKKNRILFAIKKSANYKFYNQIIDNKLNIEVGVGSSRAETGTCHDVIP